MPFQPLIKAIALKILNLFSLPLLHITKGKAYFKFQVAVLFYPLHFRLGNLKSPNYYLQFKLFFYSARKRSYFELSSSKEKL